METPRNFILVDDDPTNNILCRAVIKNSFNDTDVKAFQFPEEALTFLTENFANEDAQPAILFLDINMPSMTGWEFLDEFKKMPDNVKNKIVIYVLSSSVDAKDLEKAASNQIVKEYIQKPLRKDYLKNLLSGQG
jgi:CheY-like chemotaxis protein